MTSDHDYSEFTEAPTDENYAKLAELVEAHAKAEKTVADAEAKLKSAKATLKDVEEKQVPALMDRLGLPDCSLKSGAKIMVKKQYFARLSKDPTELHEQLAWFAAHGMDSLVKRRITVNFGRDEQTYADKLLASLVEISREGGRDFDADQRQWIEPNTLKAQVKGLMEAGELDEAGQKTLKVSSRKVAKITQPKK